MSDNFRFIRGGAYTRLVYIYTDSYRCETQVWTDMDGTMTADRSSFVFHPTLGRYKVADTCAASRNYTRSITRSELEDRQGEVYEWPLTQNGGGTYFALRSPGSNDPGYEARED